MNRQHQADLKQASMPAFAAVVPREAPPSFPEYASEEKIDRGTFSFATVTEVGVDVENVICWSNII